jgi:type IV pilus assembly protein PilA
MLSKLSKKSEKGFTLIEVLVVIGMVAILAAVVLIAVNPARQFAQGRDSQRSSNLNAILNAVGQRIADNKGVFAGTFTVGATTYTCGTLPNVATDILTSQPALPSDVSAALGCLVPTYMPALPLDPTSGSGANTGYEIFQEASTGRIHLIASTTEPSIPRTSAMEIIR